ncbi:ribose transport system substrate-binding protein [Nakamurella panacisegetis]|uniref:Ribose transport system substrate-binding protein n=2 Tax=Nakamurella panacisegetis TaxID=1090615 RepID=A0A1H0IWU3_9ACTN|nr:ribose transport system substrate-binding protein [Nakamurella panacisegetis]
MSRKRSAGVTLVATSLVLAAALSGCGSSTAASSPSSSGSSSVSPSSAADSSGAPAGSAPAGKLKVAMVIKPLDNTYFGAMAKGAQDQAGKDGVALTVVAADNVNDDSGQAAKLNAMVTAGYDCYIVNPTSQTNLLTGLVPVSKANTPIVNLDLPIDTSAATKAGVKLTTYVGTNNETAGAAGGKAMISQIPAGSQVAMIGGLVGDPGSNARMKGFSDTVQGKLKVVQTVAADFDKAKAKSAANTILLANPDIKGFFTPSGDMALGIQQAVNEAGDKGKVAVIGVDGTQDQLKDIIAGGEPAAVEQFPYLMGAQSVQACVAAKAGKTVPAKVETPVLVVTKDNAQAALAAFPAPPAGFTVPNPFK